MSRLNRPLGRREWIAAYAISITGSIAVAAITVLLVDANLAREANPITHALAGSSGWAVVLAFKFAVIVPAFQGYRILADRWHPSVGRAGAWSFAGIVSLNFVNDFGVFLSLGPVFSLDPLLELVPIALVGVVVAIGVGFPGSTKRTFRRTTQCVGPGSGGRALVLSFLMVASFVVAPISFTDTASAAPAAGEDYAAASMHTTDTDFNAGSLDSMQVSGTGDSASVVDKTSSWNTIASMPQARRWARAEGYNGKVYVAGGYDGTNTLASMIEYDPGADSWTTLSSMATARRLHAGASDSNGNFYVFGGWDSANNYIASSEKYDVGTDSWSSITSYPFAAHNLRATRHGDYIYIMGGRDSGGTRRSDVYRYDPSTDSYTALASMPAARDAGEVFTSGQYIYYVGGNDGAGNNVATVYQYDTETDSWTTLSNHPRAHDTGAGDDYKGYGYIVGGYSGSTVDNNFERYAQSSDSWTQLSTYPTGINTQAVTVLDGNIYVLGGYDGTNAVATSRTYDLSPNGMGEYTSATHSVSETIEKAWANVSVSGTTADVAFQAYTDGSWKTVNSTSISSSQNLTLDVSSTSASKWRTKITFADGGTTTEIHDEGVLYKATQEVSGQVKDQHGESCSNCTVEIVGVDSTKITPKTGQTKQERAEELLEQASNPLPDSWNPDLDLAGSGGHFENVDSEYVAIHDPEPWGLESWSSGIGDLSNPKLNPAAEEELILSVWNPAKSGAGDQLSPVNRQLPGATVNRDVVIQRLDHKGDVVDTRKVSLDKQRSVGVAGFSAYEHDFARVSLPEGVYRIHPEGASNTAYTIVVGNSDDLRKAFASELETKANHLSRAAEAFQSKIDDGTFTRKTVTTDANGRYSTTVGQNVNTVAVTAYKIDGTVLTGLSDPSPQDMRSWVVNNDYNGSVYFTVEPRKFETPTSAGNVTVRKFSSPPYALLDDWVSKWDQWRNMLENETRTDLGSLYQVDLSDWNESELETGAEDLSTLLETAYENGAQSVISQWEEERGEDWETFRNELENRDRTITELRNDIRVLEKIIFDLRENHEDPEVPPKPPTYTNETVSWSMAFNGDFDKEDVVAVWKDHDGTTTTIPDQYIEVDKRPGRGDVARVNSYPIPDGSTGGTISLTVATDDGKIGGGEGEVRNPNFEGDVPEIRAIDVSTLKPGSGERVSLEPKIETGGVKLASVEVFDGNGNTVASGVSNGRANFTAGTGTHFVRMTFTDADGNAFVETMRVPVGDSSFAYPESVAVREGRLGTYALAGDEVSDARVKVGSSGQRVDVTALVDDGSSTSEVHVYLAEAPSTPKQSVTMRVIEGDSIDTGTSLSKRIGLYVHGRELAPGTHVYRTGSAVEGGRQPIPADGSTRGGERAEGSDGGTVIKTYTGNTGAVTLETNSDPGFGERVRWRFDVFVATTSLPFTIVVPSSSVETIDAVVDELAAIVLESAAPSYSTTAPVVGVEA